ncbi:helix-turn-helix domain-containing protein [Streptomyces sp. NPDC059785]|uniref:helix-turn-helix domain-containing protein n=1 Tax=Streptomyces sp. NPDC059785 TaxID=3346945 RepID=UPI0036607AA2
MPPQVMHDNSTLPPVSCAGAAPVGEQDGHGGHAGRDGHGEPASAHAGAPSVIASRVAALAVFLGHTPEKVLNERALAEASGVPRCTVADLLAGRACGAGAGGPEERFLWRLRALRAAHRRPDGKPFSHDEIAERTRMSRQQCSALLSGTRRPTARHQFHLERFFHVPPGFLTATDDDALRRTLLEIELSLLRETADRAAAHAPPADPPRPAATRPCPPLPGPCERRARREALGLRLADVADTLAVETGQVRAWEAGQEPDGEARVRYARFLNAASGLAGLD